MRVYPNCPNLWDRPNTIHSNWLILWHLDDVDDKNDDLQAYIFAINPSLPEKVESRT